MPHQQPVGAGVSYDARLEEIFRARGRAGIVSAYLFGSRATGRSHRESDVDVAVLLRRDVYPTTRERFDARVRLTAVATAGKTAGKTGRSINGR